MAFGEKLKQLREERGLTQEDLANQLYVSRTAVSKWETNKGFPSIDTIVAIQQLFGKSIDYLIGEEDIEEALQPASANLANSIGAQSLALPLPFYSLRYRLLSTIQAILHGWYRFVYLLSLV